MVTFPRLTNEGQGKQPGTGLAGPDASFGCLIDVKFRSEPFYIIAKSAHHFERLKEVYCARTIQGGGGTPSLSTGSGKSLLPRFVMCCAPI